MQSYKHTPIVDLASEFRHLERLNEMAIENQALRQENKELKLAMKRLLRAEDNHETLRAPQQDS